MRRQQLPKVTAVASLGGSDASMANTNICGHAAQMTNINLKRRQQQNLQTSPCRRKGTGALVHAPVPSYSTPCQPGGGGVGECLYGGAHATNATGFPPTFANTAFSLFTHCSPSPLPSDGISNPRAPHGRHRRRPRARPGAWMMSALTPFAVVAALVMATALHAGVAAAAEAKTACSQSAVDLIFLLDVSPSFDCPESTQQYTVDLVDGLAEAVGADGVRVAGVTFSRDAQVRDILLTRLLRFSWFNSRTLV